jgi:hypothetical protein
MYGSSPTCFERAVHGDPQHSVPEGECGVDGVGRRPAHPMCRCGYLGVFDKKVPPGADVPLGGLALDAEDDIDVVGVGEGGEVVGDGRRRLA